MKGKNYSLSFSEVAEAEKQLHDVLQCISDVFFMPVYYSSFGY